MCLVLFKSDSLMKIKQRCQEDMRWPLSNPDSPAVVIVNHKQRKEEMFYYLAVVNMHSIKDVALQFHPAFPQSMLPVTLPGACMSQSYLCADLCASASF